MRILTCFLFLVVTFPTMLVADEGQPVAIRYWENGGVTIETMWNFHIGIRIDDETAKKLPRECDLLIGTEGVKSTTTESPQSIQWQTAKAGLVLDRNPNSKHATLSNAKTWKEAVLAGKVEPSKNVIVIQFASLSIGDNAPEKTVTRIMVDGVQIVELGDIKLEQLIAFLKSNPEKAKTFKDAIVLSQDSETSGEVCTDLKELAGAHSIVLAANKGKKIEGIHEVTHNTLAVSTKISSRDEHSVIGLASTPYEMNDEVAELFNKKETACADSRNVFAALTVKQLNFQPSNGTHTPRWNTEHMMGRELLFFSQIYNAVDSSIEIVDLNPKQNPPDYVFKHPDWTGMEEANQTERVEAFTRRFAYLLDGMDLDKRAKGSRFWTPRKLLMQMERHYNEHTANVKKKMQLPEWPKE